MILNRDPKVRAVGFVGRHSYLYKRSPLWNESLLKYDMTWWKFMMGYLLTIYERYLRGFGR